MTFQRNRNRADYVCCVLDKTKQGEILLRDHKEAPQCLRRHIWQRTTTRARSILEITDVLGRDTMSRRVDSVNSLRRLIFLGQQLIDNLKLN